MHAVSHYVGVVHSESTPVETGLPASVVDAKTVVEAGSPVLKEVVSTAE